ncbi:hypothetical protein INT43_005564 [Umbelopsis isabellina]|uniref:NET domain-containing protein n=1 Tax=Mortierella isabellina TaxID=91625 RepID=A0A8H7UB30_MORIS|nr:hypothetical protein INT43_005564 [Umbelopsis isabellina]
MTSNAEPETEFAANDDIDIEDVEDTVADVQSGRRLSTWSSGYSDSEEEVGEVTSGRDRRRYSYFDQDSSSDSNEEDYMPAVKRHSDAPMSFTERRAAEELILDRITNHLDADKLPGILSIIQLSNNDNGAVEIDLSSLTPRRLRSVLEYVEACLQEQSGGAKVNLDHYIIRDEKHITDSPAIDEAEATVSKSSLGKKSRKSEAGDYAPPKRKRATNKSTRKRSKKSSLIDLLPPIKSVSTEEITETLDPTTEDEYDDNDGALKKVSRGKDESAVSSDTGPISLAGLVSATEVDSSRISKTKTTSTKITKKPKITRISTYTSASVSTKVVQSGESIARSRPKRLAALQSMSVVDDLLEEHSDEEDDLVEANEIVWSPAKPVQEPITSLETIRTRSNEDDEDEEDIDVLD